MPLFGWTYYVSILIPQRVSNNPFHFSEMQLRYNEMEATLKKLEESNEKRAQVSSKEVSIRVAALIICVIQRNPNV
jgi:hypothetical protein